MKLFQTTAGLVPAAVPGHPVARINRDAGTVDLLQANNSKRPTLALWPITGRRNKLLSSEALLDGAGWVMTADITSTDVEVLPGIRGIFVAPELRHTAVYDRTNSAWILPHTAWPAGSGRFSRTFTAPAGCFVANFFPARIHTSSSVIYSRDGVSAVVPGQSYTVSWHQSDGKVGGIQMEPGGMTPYQKVATANWVTEAGKPHVWHLMNDEVDDDLTLLLPVGSYGRMWLTPTGHVGADTLTVTNAAVATPIWPPGIARIADLAIRESAFSSAEIEANTLYWREIYA